MNSSKSSDDEESLVMDEEEDDAIFRSKVRKKEFPFIQTIKMEEGIVVVVDLVSR